MSTELTQEVRNHTLWLTINRPERRNALNGPVIQALAEPSLGPGRRRIFVPWY
jgi:enoyl-CoA hydratase/carnithine racemase